MAVAQDRSKRKVSGGIYRDFRKKRLFNIGRDPTMTKLGRTKVKAIRVRSAGVKRVVLSGEFVNVVDPKTKKHKKVKIKAVLENPANRHFVRRNILTKGTVVDTELGKAKITSRPGQHGVINALLIK